MLITLKPWSVKELLYIKKSPLLSEPRADISPCACSDCLALTELTGLGGAYV